MKIEILNIDKLVDVNSLKEVSSPHLFSTKMTFDDEGVLSNSIFGLSRTDRLSTYAYIDLRRHFLHPHIYHNVMKNRLFRFSITSFFYFNAESICPIPYPTL